MSDPTDLKKTALYPAHLAANAKMVDFGGWCMPVQYSSILKEHEAVRTQAGVFDISHMGQFIVAGAFAAEWLNSLLTNDVRKLSPGEGQYTLLLNPEGGVIDDLFLYQTGAESFLLVVNAAKLDEDLAWLENHLAGDVTLTNRSATSAAIAIQGPNAAQIIPKVFGAETSLPPRNGIVEIRPGWFLSRTGYTGEDGFEVFFPAADAVTIWDQVLAEGQPFGLIPCGLGCRDTLRLEVCYPLNGSDLSPAITPLEAGVGWAVALDKGEFIGKPKLVEQKANGLSQRLVAFQITVKSPPPRAHYPVFHNDQQVGKTTSAAPSPSLGTGIGLTYLPLEIAKIGTAIEIEIRGRRFSASIAKKPLYKQQS